VVVAHFVDVPGAVRRYVAWVEAVEAHSMREAAALYLLGGTAFSALSPTGYLPTLLAGVMFPCVFSSGE
jgi:hypothetical protein